MEVMAVHAACCTQCTRCCPFGPCTAAVHEAPSHNRWGVVETILPAKTQGRTLDCRFNFLPPLFVAVCGFQVSLRKVQQGPTVTPIVTSPGLQEWSTPLNGAVLGVQRHSKASDAMGALLETLWIN